MNGNIQTTFAEAPLWQHKVSPWTGTFHHTSRSTLRICASMNPILDLSVSIFASPWSIRLNATLEYLQISYCNSTLEHTLIRGKGQTTLDVVNPLKSRYWN